MLARSFIRLHRANRWATFFEVTTISTALIHKSVKMSTDTTPKRLRHDAAPVIGTHSGTFHCDEVVACFMLRQLPEYENATIFRSRVDADLHAKCDIIVDVGGIFDHERKLYDHHQTTFKDTLSSLRPELEEQFSIRLSSAGLVYAFYGERILASILKRRCNLTLSEADLRLVYIQVYHNFISEIDAIDNGVPMFANGQEGKPIYTISTHISARIGKLNPSWEETDDAAVDIDERFHEAMRRAGEEFVENVVQIGGSWIKARQHVRDALLSAKSFHASGEILLLERFCPWKKHLSDLEREHDLVGVPKLVIFCENANSWRVCGVPLSPNSFLGRKFLPPAWRGLRDKALSSKAGIEGLLFVHHTGFIGGASTKEAALQMARKSVEWPADEDNEAEAMERQT